MGGDDLWWMASPQPCPLPGMFIWAAAGLTEELTPVVLEVRVPEVRSPLITEGEDWPFDLDAFWPLRPPLPH